MIYTIDGKFEKEKLLSDRIGDYIQTFSGKKFYPLDPRIEEIDVHDIAHALSNVCRFTGHQRNFYSVSEHCCHMADFFMSDRFAVLMDDWSYYNYEKRFSLAKWALFHDASEAYIADIARPVKKFLTNYQDIENNIMFEVAKKFDLNPKQASLPYEIKLIDNNILFDERDQNMTIPKEMWGGEEDRIPLNISIECWGSYRAKREFMFRYLALEAKQDWITEGWDFN